ncbi:MAG: helix-turn-helix domain-containing protein [Christensenellales bacterium]
MKRYFSSGFFKKTLLCYMLILLLPVLIFSGFFYRQLMLAEQQRQAVQYEREAMAINNSVAGKLSEIYSLGQSLTYTPWLKKVRSNSDILFGEFTTSKRNEIITEMWAQEAIISICDRIAIYLPYRDIVISSSGWLSGERFMYPYQSQSRIDADEYERFYDMIAATDSFQVVNLADEGFRNVRGNELLVVQSLDSMSRPRAVLFCHISGASLAALAGNSLDLARLDLYAGDKLFFACDFKPEVGDAPLLRFSLRPEVAPIALISEFSFAPSQPTGGMSTFTTLFTVVTLALAAGTVLAFLLAQFTYRPIRRLLQNMAGSKDLKGDDIEAIERAVRHVMSENSRLEEMVKQNESIARTHRLLNLLHGSFDVDAQASPADDMLLSDSDLYQVMIICPGSSVDKEKLAQLQYILVNAREGLYALSLYSGELVLICQIEQGASLNTYIEAALYSLKLDPNEFILQYGTLEKGIFGISVSFQNARENYGQLQPQEMISCFYPTDWEMQLINRLKIGDFAVVERILTQIRLENGKRELSTHLRLRLVSRVYETLIRVALEMNIDTRRLSEAFYRQVKLLDYDRNWSVLFSTAKTICNKTMANGETNTVRLGERILEYVDKHYAEADLSLIRLEDAFEISQSSISRIFKQTVRINFIDYLSRLRVEKAKEMMRAEDVTVGEISARVGYENEATFRRVFKRYEGFSPTQYIKGVAARRLPSGASNITQTAEGKRYEVDN